MLSSTFKYKSFNKYVFFVDGDFSSRQNNFILFRHQIIRGTMFKIIIPFFLILAFFCSCKKTSENAVVWFDKANALWDGQKYTDPKKAIEYLSNAIKLQPDYASAYYNRGNAYYGLGQYQRAIKDYSEAIRLKPNDVDSHYNRANAYFNQGNNTLGCRDAKKMCSFGDCKVRDSYKVKGLCP